jgi:7,8-dihydropterin-6-yl-methyl-4-(beta-D-ribofuranosyl)aminobenzene 5'-phosphate synthase
MEEKKISRRSFIQGMALGTVAGYFASAGLSSTVFKKALLPKEKLNQVDIGEIKSLKLKVVSETSWFDNKVFLKDVKDAGGLLVNQYTIPWSIEGVKAGYQGSNLGGYSTYIEATPMDGKVIKIQLDTGWNPEWMEKRFREEGIAEKLGKKEIDFMVLSHEHIDHFFGIEATTKFYPDIPIYIPKGFYQEGYDLLKGKSFPKAHVKNNYPHKGKVTVLDSKKVNILYPGIALMTFDVPIILRVFGEQAFIFNVKDKGLVLVTGCCHMGIISYMEAVRKKIKGSEKIYAIQGGLHISPFEDWDPQYDDLILAFNKYGVQKIGANHCTGYITAEKMIKAGLPVVKGTARNMTKRDIYLGNGDELAIA